MPEESKNKDLPKIWVKAGTPDRVGVSERHPEHPNGEVLVVPNDKPGGENEAVQVAETTLVLQQLQNGLLVRVSGPAGREVKAEDDRPAAKR